MGRGGVPTDLLDVVYRHPEHRATTLNDRATASQFNRSKVSMVPLGKFAEKGPTKAQISVVVLTILFNGADSSFDLVDTLI